MRWIKRLLRNLGLSIVAVMMILSASYIIDFSISNVSLNRVARFYSGQLKLSINEFTTDIRREPTIKRLELMADSESHILKITFKYVDEHSLDEVVINNDTYVVDTTEVVDDLLIAYVPFEISFEESEISKRILVSAFKVDDKVYSTYQVTMAFKDIDYAVLAEKKKSVVKLSIRLSSGLTQKTSFGSGVIFKKELSAYKIFGVQAYDYYILTNYHVIQPGIKNDKFSGSISVHYGDVNNTYPKVFEPNPVVVGWYTENTDLAIIKFTTTDNNVAVLEDEQFITKTPIEVVSDQVVFLIGSPASGNENVFNAVQEGVVLSTDSLVRLKDEPTLCQYGCAAIQTDAYLGRGSSGGGVFNSNGHLIGIHFAGDPDYLTSSEIPMAKVLEAIEYILYEKVELFYEVPLFLTIKHDNLSL